MLHKNPSLKDVRNTRPVRPWNGAEREVSIRERSKAGKNIYTMRLVDAESTDASHTCGRAPGVGAAALRRLGPVHVDREVSRPHLALRPAAVVALGRTRRRREAAVRRRGGVRIVAPALESHQNFYLCFFSRVKFQVTFRSHHR